MSGTSALPGENTEAPKGPVIGAYFGRISELLEKAEDSRALAHALGSEMGSKRFLTSLETMAEIERLHTEMRLALDEFTGRRSGMVIVKTIDHLCASMKVYIISLFTMMDLLAQLVNVVLDLGIAERDVRQRLVLRNDHVRATRIPKLVAEYEHRVDMAELRKRRNDVVHRGAVPDSEVIEALKARNRLDSRRYSLLTSNPIADDEYKKCLSELQRRLDDLARGKQERFRAIHSQTIAMTSEVAGELGAEMVVRCQRKAIERQAGADRPDAAR